MACHQISAKPLSEPMLDPWEQWNFNQIILIQEKLFNENVCKMVAILP